MKFRYLPAALALGLLATAPVTAYAATPAPVVGDPHPAAVAAPYPAIDNGPTAFQAALARSKQSGKPVLADFGGNWCPDCRLLAGTFELPAVQDWLSKNFEVVSINVGHFDANMDLAQSHGVKITAVPTVLIITPDGRTLNPDGARELGHARAMSSQAVVDLIAGWAGRS
ncbi:protein disulfide isomerase [Ameyamaea chiangmaiensis NBRC 103196]|uniref:Thioredoxin family protein n=1 Tax=Ameyamaea chiangmaiensis TaxID=442969 RepID=A0A850PHC5_9PROT|nr:thioredoxin family protein [Ameyamaea chiangmaiensis]MBS4074278.1 thioredoxin family protein [Ameyamaea chiangmaiensis]NVN40571.1 thioredoxin family protein [Ameyamaea chiangmaiensis]GBQ71478.1 protein disulfide isomerase [Ameyamaea chiangmaiensis NBRC 103196]